jgi:hypothetical protein
VLFLPEEGVPAAECNASKQNTKAKSSYTAELLLLRLGEVKRSGLHTTFCFF